MAFVLVKKIIKLIKEFFSEERENNDKLFRINSGVIQKEENEYRALVFSCLLLTTIFLSPCSEIFYASYSHTYFVHKIIRPIPKTKRTIINYSS